MDNIFKQIDILFKSEGFKLKNKIWYKQYHDNAILIHYQKSTYSETLYLGVAIRYNYIIKVKDVNLNLFPSADIESRINKILMSINSNYEVTVNMDNATFVTFQNDILARILPLIYTWCKLNFSLEDLSEKLNKNNTIHFNSNKIKTMLLGLDSINA